MKPKNPRILAGLVAAITTLTLAGAGAQTTFNWTGGTDGTGTLMFTPPGYENWDPTLAAADFSAGSENLFRFATRTDGGPGNPIGGGNPLTFDNVVHVGGLIFENPDGHYPGTLVLRPNASGTGFRSLNFNTPGNTIISLDETVTGTVQVGTSTSSASSASNPHGNLVVRIPGSGVSTIHVANAAATLDMRRLVDNNVGRGGINSNSVGDGDARLRKTGPGTLDLRMIDAQGNNIGGLIVEEGTVLLARPTDQGNNPGDFMADHVVVHGGAALVFDSHSTNAGSSRGYQLGEANGGAELSTVGSAHAILGVISDMPGQAGRLVKTGDALLRLAGDNTYSGGTVIQEGVMRATSPGSFGTGPISIEDGAGISTFNVAAGEPAPLIGNDIDVLGENVIFGDAGTSLARNRLRLGGNVDLNGNTIFLQLDFDTEFNGLLVNGGIAEITGRENSHSLVLNGTNTFDDYVQVMRGQVYVNGETDITFDIMRGGADGEAVSALGGSGTINADAYIDGELRPGAAFITSDTEDSVGTLTLNGDLYLNDASEAFFEIRNTSEYDSMVINGNADLGGTLTMVLVDGFVPEIGDSFQILDVSGGISTGPNFALNVPFIAEGVEWDVSNLETTGTISLVAGAFSQTFTWDGGFAGSQGSLFDSGSWDPALTPDDIASGSFNDFLIAPVSGDAPIANDYTFTLDASPRIRNFIFDDPDGVLPPVLNIGSSSLGIFDNLIYFDVVDATAITLTESVTTTVRFGHDTGFLGNIGFRLPNTGTTTFHVANAAATLDLSGLRDDSTDRGAIHAGDVVQTDAHASLRKTGDGTLDLRTEDPEGNRYRRLIVEGGTAVIGSTLHMHWLPSTVLADSVILDGGTIQLASQSGIWSTNRGIQVGEAGGTIEVFGINTGTNSLISDLPGQAGVLRKSGTAAFRLVNDNSYTGGTEILDGRLRFTTNGSLGSGPVTMHDDAILSAWVAGLELPNDINVVGETIRFNGDGQIGAFNGNIDLGGQLVTIGMGNSTIFNGVVSNGGILLSANTNEQRLELNGANTYDDSTAVDRGNLMVNGSITSDVLVSRDIPEAGAVGALGGSGTVFGNVAIDGALRPGPEPFNSIGTLTIDGDLFMTQQSVFSVDVAPDGTHDVVSVSGALDLDGTIELVFFGGFDGSPGDVVSLQIFNATGGITTGPNFQFDVSGASDIVSFDTSNFATTGAVNVTITGIARDFDWTGGFGGNGTVMFAPGGFENWSPELTAEDIGASGGRVMLIASRIGGGPLNRIGNGLPLGVDSNFPRVSKLVFDNAAGHFPEVLTIQANSEGTARRRLVYTVPNSTIISLEDTVTGTVRIGDDFNTTGELSIRLPNEGTSTIHVGNAAATLDLSYLRDNIVGWGGISAGNQTSGNWASPADVTLRKTGPGTLDIGMRNDAQGARVRGLLIEDGTVLIRDNADLGWAPPEFMEDHVVINGGSLVFESFGTNSGSTRGFQVGENGGRIVVTGSPHAINAGIDNVPGQDGVLIKAGDQALRLASDGNYSGGTIVEDGLLRATSPLSFGTGPVSIHDGAGISTFNVASGDPAPQLMNDINVLGENVILGDFGTGLLRNTLRLGGAVDLGGNDVIVQLDYHTEIDGPLENGRIAQVNGRENFHLLVLNGTNSTSGDTVVNRGVLLVNSSLTGDVTTSRSMIDLENEAIGTLSGGGDVDGNVIVNGEIAPGLDAPPSIGTLTISGNLIIGEDGVGRFEASGNGSSDMVSVSGNVTIDGTIVVELVSGYVPASGHSIQLVDSFGTITLGGGAAFDLPALDSGLEWDTSAFASTGTLTVTGDVVSDGYDAWVASFGLTGGDALRTADPDGDGFTNFQEFAFGTSPIAANGSLSTSQRVGGNLVVTYLERNSGVNYQVQSSTTLQAPWGAAAGITFLSPVDQAGVPADYTRVSFSVPVGTREFFRIEATEP